MKKILTLAYLLVLMAPVSSQINQTASADLIDPILSQTENLFLNNQAEALLGQANSVLLEYPPNWPEPAARQSALLLLDGVLHDVYAPHRPPVQSFFKARLKKAIDEIEQTPVKEDMKNQWSTFKVGEVTASVGRKLSPAWNKTKEVTSKAGKKIGEVSKKAYTGTKNLVSKEGKEKKEKQPKEKKKKDLKDKTPSEEIVNPLEEEISIPEPPNED